MELFEKQITLNKKFNGDDWISTIDIKNLKIAILTEVAELCESKPSVWKWWKLPEDDEQNAYIELVDIIHFSLSYILMNNNVDSMIKENELLDFIDFSYDITEELSLFLCTPSLENFYGFISSLMNFFDLSIGKVISVYNSKNELNHKRVDGGYMEGTYNKYENDTEDNKRIKI